MYIKFLEDYLGWSLGYNHKNYFFTEKYSKGPLPMDHNFCLVSETKTNDSDEIGI